MNRMNMMMPLLALTLLLAACGTPAAAPVANEAAPAVAAAAETATEAATEAAPAADTAAQATDGATAPITMTKLNLNVATAEEFLATIPALPNRMTREFDEYRPYVSILEFRQEIGKYVDDATVAEYEKYLYVPVKVNDSDVASLQQLPGVTEAIAGELMAGRPYAGNAAFLAKLATLVSAEEAATAAAYLEAE